MKTKYIIILVLIGLLTIIQLKLFSQDKSENIIIESIDINTENSEFAAVYHNQNVIFVSDRKPISLLSKEDENTGRSFYDLFSNSEDKKIIDLLNLINTTFHEGPLCFSSDYNTVFFTRNAYYQGKKRYSSKNKMPLQIFYLTFNNGKWSEISEFPLNSLEYSVGHPWLSNDGKFLYFSSNMPGGYGGSDIYRISIAQNGFGEVENLGASVNTEFDELFPSIGYDNFLYFSSNATGGYGGLDIFKAELKDNKFIHRVRLDKPINSEYDDFAFSIYIDNNSNEHGMFSSNRPGGKGLDDVYKWKENSVQLKIRGVITNAENLPLKDVLLSITDANGKTKTVRTDVAGNYEFEVQRASFCNIALSHKDYFDDDFDVSTNVEATIEYIDYNIKLETHPVFTIKPVNADNTPITGMRVKINCDGQDVYTGVSDANGISWEFPKHYKRGDSVNLVIDFNKKSYINRKVVLNMVIEQGGEIVIPRENLVFIKAEEKLEISKIIDLKPIYYDLAKWDIRTDAAFELEKVVEFLNNNPDVVIELSSHTDCRGSDNDNLILSQKRAAAASDYIQSQISNPKQISGKGYGETRLLTNCKCDDCSEQEHARNRRTEFTIVKVN